MSSSRVVLPGASGPEYKFLEDVEGHGRLSYPPPGWGSTTTTWHGSLSTVHLDYDASSKFSAGKKARGVLFRILSLLVTYLTTGNYGYRYCFWLM
jgi:hypothetical protein